MPHTLPACPQCGQENTYPDGDNYICPDCAHEWPQAGAAPGELLHVELQLVVPG